MSGLKHCFACNTTKPTAHFWKNKLRKDGFQSQCKSCHGNLNKEWASNNRDKANANTTKWRKANLDKDCAKVARRAAAKLQRMLAWGKNHLKKDIQIWYHRAQLATIFMEEPYQVDHIVPLRGKEVSGLHVPWNLQLLTKEENLKKGNRHKVNAKKTKLAPLPA